MFQNIHYDGKEDQIHIWDDELGYQKFKFQPYGYLPNQNGAYQALDGTRVDRVSGVLKDNPNSYESDLNAETRTLIDLYYESDVPSKGHRNFFFDIEVDISQKLPTPEEADCKITSIAYLDKITGDREVLVLDEKRRLTKKLDTKYSVRVFSDERDLLTYFINKFAEIQPTVITGWNTDRFDIPYLINRIKNTMGAGAVKKLSPAGIVEYLKHRNTWKIAGVSSLDYLKLYKNFTYTELPNYRLDTVAKTEVGRGKIEYDGDLNDLFETDINKFIEYNMVDVDLVHDIDEKLQLINLARTICHKGHVPYEDVFYSSRYLDAAAIVDLKRNGFVAPNKEFRFIEEETAADALAGAYVMPPIPGLYKWIYDLDLTSLYPSIIMTLNISPETKIGVIKNWDELDMLQVGAFGTLVVKGSEIEIDDVHAWLKENNYTIASNGAVYETSKKGFLPEILAKWFDERVLYKNKRDEYEVGSDDYKFYDALQLTQKVLLNSFYGVLGLKTFRFHDLDNAGAITATGQSIIKFSAKAINKYYQNITGTDHFLNGNGQKAEYSFYTDTDSTFVSSLPILQKRYPGFDETDEAFMIEKTNEVASEVQKHVNAMYDIYADRFHNTKSHRFQIKQEYVAKSGLWIAKKRYAQWVIFKEGKPTNKLDVKGLDVVRSSFPEDFKQIMKDTLWYILKEKNKTETTDLIMNFKHRLKDSTILNVMKNSGVKNITKYIKGREPFGPYMSGTPAHVKSAINYNDLITRSGTKVFAPLIDGEKVKWAYLTTNPYGFDTMALRGYEDPPEIIEFVETYIDRNKIFERELKGKIDDFYASLGWDSLPVNNNVNKFFSF